MALSQESRSIIELPTPIERSDRLPAGRVPLLAFVADRQTKTDVEESLAPLALADSPVMRGGVGTTTVAVNLAWYLANRQNRRVALLDLNLQRGDCALALNVTPTAGLREALTNPTRLDLVFLERVMRCKATASSC